MDTEEKLAVAAVAAGLVVIFIWFGNSYPLSRFKGVILRMDEEDEAVCGYAEYVTAPVIVRRRRVVVVYAGGETVADVPVWLWPSCRRGGSVEIISTLFAVRVAAVAPGG